MTVEELIQENKTLKFKNKELQNNLDNAINGLQEAKVQAWDSGINYAIHAIKATPNPYRKDS